METAQQDSHEQQYDFDHLRNLALAAAACLRDVRLARETSQPTPSTEPLEQFALYASPALVLLVMHRLRGAMELVDAARGAMPDMGMRKRMDVFMSGVLTDADLLAAWPHHAADVPDATGTVQ